MLRQMWPLFFLVLFLSMGCANDQENKTSASLEKQSPNGKEFIIAGSGTNLPVTGKLIERYQKKTGQKIKMPNSIGSGGGIEALKQGAIEIALTSRPLKAEEKANGLKEMAYMRVALVIAVHPDVPDNNISYEDLVNIFQGTKSQWKDGKKIIVLSRDKEESTNKVLAKAIPGFKEALEESIRHKRWEVFYSDWEEAKAIMETNNAIGFTDSGTLETLELKIKPLQVNGVEPKLENVLNGTYGLSKDLFFVYKTPLSERAQDFIGFVLSKEGKEVISENGGYPIE